MLFKASAPGSLMLLGEYAVLQGKNAIVCAVDKRMHVALMPREDNKIIISSALGQLETDLATLKVVPPFQFVLTALKKFLKKMPSGCDIEIISEFSHQIGFGSSAAVTVATLSAISHWLNLSLSELELVRTARAIIREVQGLGSGADVAACVFGGVIAYRMKPLSVEKIASELDLVVVYSGSKTPTAEAVTRVKNYFEHHPKLFQQICQAIDGCAVAGKQAISDKDWMSLGKIMNVQQGLMDALGVNTPVLNDIVNGLRQRTEILGAKISGSGLGDCVIGLVASSTAYSSSLQQYHQIPIKISPQGVLCEKN